MMFSGMPLAMRVEYAVFIMTVLPLIVLGVLSALIRTHLTATSARLRSEGGVSARLLPYGAMASLIVSAIMASLVFGMNSMGDMASTAGADSTSFGGALMICGIAIMLCALTMVMLVAVAMTSSTVGELLRLALGLPSTLRCDRHVADAARSWARPQWVPRWARFSLPDPRI
ncbi:hypothetical protein [Bifidobacterium vansinderenii]|uniref:Uncharacterized protein n=1 Tax=Bifidobacterium vansinderenii TaxID=1984871 RepID=A0A229VXZ7_9BIFI|nr:hypothetical protein [Bifidobacterium vansinderenii]OXN00495.1 hypothetical protein Tam10B_1365 [Bifidobacterium vansinderenii]